MTMTPVCVVVVRKFSAALVVLRRAALEESKQTDDAGLDGSYFDFLTLLSPQTFESLSTRNNKFIFLWNIGIY